VKARSLQDLAAFKQAMVQKQAQAEAERQRRLEQEKRQRLERELFARTVGAVRPWAAPARVVLQTPPPRHKPFKCISMSAPSCVKA
jgi:hypothetical protein